jgi:hypothetical protein
LQERRVAEVRDCDGRLVLRGVWRRSRVASQPASSSAGETWSTQFRGCAGTTIAGRVAEGPEAEGGVEDEVEVEVEAAHASGPKISGAERHERAAAASAYSRKAGSPTKLIGSRHAMRLFTSGGNRSMRRREEREFPRRKHDDKFQAEVNQT